MIFLDDHIEVLPERAQQSAWFPLSAAVVGAQGSDSFIVNTIQEAMEDAGWPTQVKTGRLAFELSEDLRDKREHDFPMEL